MAQKFNPLSGNFDTVLDKASEIKYDNSGSGLTATDLQDAVDEVQANIDDIPTPLTYKGTWNATTNTPTLANTDTGKEGWLYQVNVAGTQDFGAGAISFEIGDKVANNGTTWDKWDMTDSVTSVNGEVGAVVLDTGDISEGSNLYFTDERAQDAVGNILGDTSTIDLIYNDAGNSITANVIDASITDAKLSTGINANKIADGSVTNTEFQYLGNVTSDIQTQLDGKQATGNYITALTGDVTATGPGSVAATIATDAVTTTKILNAAVTNDKIATGIDAVKLADGSVSNTELQYINSVTSNVQDQLNARTQDTGFITNGQAEVDASGWVTYADAAQRLPVDGTGGSANVTFTRSTSSPIKGAASFIFTKDAANRQGQGASYDFTVPAGNQARVNNIFVDYRVVSGTFTAGSNSTDSDLIMYMYDVTNSTLIEPSSIKLLSNSTTLSDRFSATFQTSATGTQYRLIIHCATTSASAYVVMFDNITVAQSQYVYGTPITDWQSYTPTGSFTTNTTYTGRRRRVGDNEEFCIGLSFSGAPNAVNLSLNLPVTIDTTKLPISAQYQVNLGNAQGYKSPGGYNFQVIYNSTTTVAVAYVNTGTTGAQGLVTNTAPVSWASGDTISASFSIPVVGYSSSVQMSDTTDTRVIAAKCYLSGSNQTGVNPNNSAVKINLNATLYDTAGGFNAGLSRYVAQVSGYYQVTGSVLTASTNVLNNQYVVFVYKNGSFIAQGQYLYPPASNGIDAMVTDIIQMNSGDYLELYLFGAGNNSASTLTASASSGAGNYLAINRISGPAAIAANETVAARYTTTAGNSITSSEAVIVFATKDYDTHNAYNTSTGLYTCPISGLYEVSGTLRKTNTNFSTSQTLFLTYGKNGGGTVIDTVVGNGAAIEMHVRNKVTVRCNAGDTLSINAASTISTSLVTTAGLNYIEIRRVGN